MDHYFKFSHEIKIQRYLENSVSQPFGLQVPVKGKFSNYCPGKKSFTLTSVQNLALLTNFNKLGVIQGEI